MASLLSPQRPPCFHKTLARCMLSTPGCCACSDSRPHAHDYYVYVDGVGSVPQGTRWSYYCDHCKAYWESNIRRAGISASQSRIPEFPRPNLSDGSSTPRSPPGSRRTPASAFSQMEQYLTNNPLAHRPHPGRPLLSAGRAGRERDAEPSLASTAEPDSASQSDARRRLQRLQSLRTSDRTYSSGSEGSMDAQASSTADDVEMPAQSRNLLSFVESRAQITDLENQLGRLQARMLGGRNAQAAREEFQREADRRHRLAPPPQRHQFHIAPRSDSRGRYDAATAGDRSWASNATDGSNSVASLDGSSSSVSIEVRASTPPRTVDGSEPPDQSEESTPTSIPASGPPARVWSLANSVQDIETELAHLSEGAARRSAELASLSQQLEQQTRQYAAHRSAVDSESGSPSGMRDHSDILGRASEGLRQLRELRERREQHERTEQIQQVWGNVDDEEYVSPVSALFQRSWQAYNRRQQLERDGVRPTLQSVWFPDGGGSGGSGSSPSLTEPDPAPIRTPLDLITEAGEASNLLQSFLENHDGDSITPEQQELVDRAVEAILRMRREVRARSRSTRESSRRSRRSRGPGPGQRAWAEPKGLDDADRPPPMEPELLVLDCECKVCFGQIADTVLLPCSHLVLCGWCADQMGIRKASEFARTVQCPICRADVFDRIKIFRG